MVPTAPFLGFSGLLEQLIELRKTVYLLEDPFTRKYATQEWPGMQKTSCRGRDSELPCSLWGPLLSSTSMLSPTPQLSSFVEALLCGLG